VITFNRSRYRLSAALGPKFVTPPAVQAAGPSGPPLEVSFWGGTFPWNRTRSLNLHRTGIAYGNHPAIRFFLAARRKRLCNWRFPWLLSDYSATGLATMGLPSARATTLTTTEGKKRFPEQLASAGKRAIPALNVKTRHQDRRRIRVSVRNPPDETVAINSRHLNIGKDGVELLGAT
jgi:hypothetical protein